MTDLLIYDLIDWTPTGTLCNYKETAEAEETQIMPNTPLKELYNLYRYMQHVILESGFDCDDEEFDNPLDEGKWLLQTRRKIHEICNLPFFHCYRTKKHFQSKTCQF